LKTGSKKTARAGAGNRPQANGKWLDMLEQRLSHGRIFGIMALASVLYTFPLVLSMGSKILGNFTDYYGDIFHGTSLLWSAKEQLLNLHANPLRYDLLAGPYSAFYYSILAAYKPPIVNIPVTALLGPVCAVNVFTLLNFTLAGFFSYLLVLDLTRNKVAGLFAGLVFAFCPYAYAHAVVHMDLGATWPIVMVFWAGLRLDRKRTLGNIILLLFSLLLFHIYCSLYYYLFFPLAAGSFLLIRFVDSFLYSFQTGQRIKGAFARVKPAQWILASASILLVAAGVIALYKYYLGPTAHLTVRPIHWQERFRLSWANYLLPGVDHPWFGRLTDSVVPVRRNVTESTAYIGWVPLLLALYNLKVAGRDWRAFMFLVFGLASLIFTLGPYISLGYLNLPLPSILLHKIAPFIRVISRYSIFLQLSVAVFAGYGLLLLLRRYKNRAGWILAVSLTLLAVEFIRPSGMTAVASNAEQAPPIYACLAGLSEDVTVFEYPPAATTGVPFGDYLYFQMIHGKRLFNRHYETTSIPGEYLPFWQDMDYPGAICDPNNVALLRYFGVDYVAGHDRSTSPVPSFPTAELARVEGLELIENFGRDALYRVTAEPATVLISFDTQPYYNYLEAELEMGKYDFGAPLILGEGPERLGWRIMRESGRLSVRNLLDTPQKVEIVARAVSFLKPRSLEIAVKGGPGEQMTIDTAPRDIKFGPLDLPANGTVEVMFHSPEGVSELPTKAGKIRASIALARLQANRLQ